MGTEFLLDGKNKVYITLSGSVYINGKLQKNFCSESTMGDIFFVSLLSKFYFKIYKENSNYIYLNGYNNHFCDQKVIIVIIKKPELIPVKIYYMGDNSYPYSIIVEYTKIHQLPIVKRIKTSVSISSVSVLSTLDFYEVDLKIEK